MSDRFLEGTYARFHFDNVYQTFFNKVHGRSESKTTVFFRHCKDKDALFKITTGTHPDYRKVDKPGCKNGIIVEKGKFEDYWQPKMY